MQEGPLFPVKARTNETHILKVQVTCQNLPNQYRFWSSCSHLTQRPLLMILHWMFPVCGARLRTAADGHISIVTLGPRLSQIQEAGPVPLHTLEKFVPEREISILESSSAVPQWFKAWFGLDRGPYQKPIDVVFAGAWCSAIRRWSPLSKVFTWFILGDTENSNC